MKKIILFSVVLIVLIFVYIFANITKKDTFQVINPPSPTPKIVSSEGVSVSYKNVDYKASWTKVSNPKSISLIPNFNEKLDSSDVYQNLGCNTLTSAGFYSKEEKPLGLFIYDGVTLGREVESALLNSFFVITKNGMASIDKALPAESDLKIALQSGPLLINNGLSERLSIIDDEEARRLAVAITDTNEVIFMVFYKEESVFQGPLLQDMPDIINVFQNKTGVIIKSATNLDGGTASSFQSKTLQLSELAHSGSFFCIK